MSTRLKGAIGQYPVGKTAVGSGYNKTLSTDSASVLPSFSQALTGTLTEYEVTADIGNTLPLFTQDVAGTVGQKTVTANTDSELPNFVQFATSVENPPTIAEIAQVLPSISTSIIAVHTVTAVAGTSVQTLPSFQTKGYLSLEEVIFVDIDNELPNFRQQVRGNVGIKAVSGVLGAILPSMQQSIMGGLENDIVDALISSNLPNFSQNLLGAIDQTVTTGQILNNLPQFTQNSAGTAGNKAVSVNITAQLPSFIQNIDAEYTVSSANGSISAVLPRFQTNVGININDGVVRSVFPSFRTHIRAARTPNSTLENVVEPVTVTTLGTIVLQEEIPDNYAIKNTLVIDRTSQTTINRDTSAITIDTKVVIHADFKQHIETNLIQRRVINYANDNFA